LPRGSQPAGKRPALTSIESAVIPPLRAQCLPSRGNARGGSSATRKLRRSWEPTTTERQRPRGAYGAGECSFAARSPRTHRRHRGVPMPYQPSTLGPPFARAAFPARNAAQRASAPQRCACGRWPHDPPPVGSHGADRSGATAESMMSSRAVAEARGRRDVQANRARPDTAYDVRVVVSVCRAKGHPTRRNAHRSPGWIGKFPLSQCFVHNRPFYCRGLTL
jgi:hypothetical protein